MILFFPKRQTLFEKQAYTKHRDSRLRKSQAGLYCRPEGQSNLFLRQLCRLKNTLHRDKRRKFAWRRF